MKVQWFDRRLEAGRNRAWAKLGPSNAVHVFIFACLLFPFIRVVPSGGDIQPHTTALMLISLLVLALRQAPVVNLLAVPAIAAPLVGLSLGDPLYEIVRSSAIYGGVFATYAYTAHAIRSGFPVIAMLKAVFHINLVLGAIQFFIDPFLFDFISPVRTSLDRGVTALSVEPSFYGLTMTLVGLIIIAFAKTPTERVLYLALGFVQIAIFSQSSIAVAIFVASSLLFLLLHVRIGHPLVLGIIALAAGLALFALLVPSDSRIYTLMQRALLDPWGTVASDRSASIRVSHIVLSNAGAFMGLLVPNGFAGFSEFVVGVAGWPLQIIPSNRILSAYGGALFELGIFALPLLAYNFPYLFPQLRRRYTQPPVRSMLVPSLAVLMVFMNALSFALPLYAICLAIINDAESVKRNEMTTATPHGAPP